MALLVHGNLIDTADNSERLILDRLEITKPASKTSFLRNDTFTIDGLEVVAIYIENETEYYRVVTNECVFNPTVGSVLSSKGDMQVEISYSDLEVTKTISYGIYIKYLLNYHSTATALQRGRNSLAGTSNENYAIFAGGSYDTSSNSETSAIDAYDEDLVRTNGPYIYMETDYAAASVGDYAVFAGGWAGSISEDVFPINGQLVVASCSPLSEARFSLAGASTLNNVIFAGGNDNGTTLDTIDSYNYNLVKKTPTRLSFDSDTLAGASVGQYALFAGEYHYKRPDYYASEYVNGYNDNLVRISVSYMSEGRGDLASASVGNYALFAGGFNGTTGSVVVDAYDSNLVRSTPTTLSVGRLDLASTSVGDYALFAGGRNYVSYGAAQNTVDVYDTDLVHTSGPEPLTGARYDLAGASIGEYALFAGGYLNIATVDVYGVA